MPRPTPHAASITSAVSNLIAAVTDLVTGVKGALQDAHLRAAAARVKDAAAGTVAAVSAKSAKLKKALKASWARYTPAQRAERVRKMLAGRGLKPKGAGTKKVAAGKGKRRGKGKTGAAAKARAPRGLRGKLTPERLARLKKATVSSWTKLTPEARAARIAKMQAGRGLKAKTAAPS